MHGSDAGLRSVAQQNQDESQPHGRLVKLGCIVDEDRPVETRQGFRPLDLTSRVVSQNRTEQSHGQADTSDDGVLPCCLERCFASVKRDEEHGRQSGAFDGYPEYPEVVCQSDEYHGKNKQRR